MMDARTPEDVLRASRSTREERRPPPSIAEFLSAEAWLARDFPEPEPLLGELIVAGIRMFVVGRTGLGKTLLGMAMAVAMASGQAFLHWRPGRPARVLYIDGEMPGALLRQRLRDELRRAGNPDLAGRLIIFGRDIGDEVAKAFPTLGEMPPLNTEPGRVWLLALIDAVGGADVVLLDNVMSLLVGAQKDEEPWTAALDLVDALSHRRIAQVWLDHTGHDSSRQYGSSTKSWRMDTVGIMAPLDDDQHRPGEVAFRLAFDPPGKCRRRTPQNWRDYETVIIRLADDRWTSEAAGSPRKAAPPKARLFHGAMLDALAAGRGIGPGKVSRAAWLAECERRSLIEAAQGGETGQMRHARTAPFRRALIDLLAVGWVGADGDTYTDLTRLYAASTGAA